MDTLVSQAYGARNYRYIGVVFQNALVVVSAIFIPIALCFWFTEPVLLLFRQDPHLAKMAGSYNRWLIPGVLPLLIYRAQTQYLQNQRILKPAIVAGALSVVLSLPLNYLFIFGLPELPIFGLQHGLSLHVKGIKVFGGWHGLGFIGAPIAGSLTWLSQPIFLWIYVSITGEHRQTWNGCDMRQAFDVRNLLNFLKLGIPASLMLAMEVIGFEIATLFVGSFADVTAVKAHAIGFNLTTMIFIVPIGLSIGSATRVGNLLGEGNSKGAKFSTFVGALIIIASLIFLDTILLMFRSIIPRLYSDSAVVIDVCKKMMPLVAALSFFDGLQTFNGSIMRAVGQQFYGSIVNFLGYYLLAIPIAAGLGFGAKWKLYGVWCGLVAGLAGAFAGYLILMIRIDWEKEAQLAKKRVSEGAAQALSDDSPVPLPDNDYLPLADTLSSDDSDTSLDIKSYDSSLTLSQSEDGLQALDSTEDLSASMDDNV